MSFQEEMKEEKEKNTAKIDCFSIVLVNHF